MIRVYTLKEGDSVAKNNDLAQIRRDVEHLVGEKVRLKANKGRKKISVKEGILEKTYPNIFVVCIDGGYNTVRRVSYSYSDILTETVEITLCDNEKKIQAS
nr:Veg family protein [Marinisporobacter balticus]